MAIEISASSGNTIGGTASGEGNTIAFNTDDGVDVIVGQRAIRSSPIRSSPTACSASRWTARPTTPSLAPTVTAALPDTALASTEIDGTYTGAGRAPTYLIQFFSTPGAVAQGGVEGETYIGSTTVKTDSTGALIGLVNGVFSIDVAGGRGHGRLGHRHRDLPVHALRLRPDRRRHVRVLQPADPGRSTPFLGRPIHCRSRPGGYRHRRHAPLRDHLLQQPSRAPSHRRPTTSSSRSRAWACRRSSCKQHSRRSRPP